MSTGQAQRKEIPVPITGPLDEVSNPSRIQPGTLTACQNAVYRRRGAVGKRTGSGPYVGAGKGTVPGNFPVVSGYRWYRGKPSALTQMVVQSNDRLFACNDSTGVQTQIGAALAAGSTPAFFTSAYDPAASSDVMIVAYGSGPPLKYDGTTLSQLNASITNNFTGCVFWHEHVWLWGDPNYPDTLFATDLGQPESFAFVNSFGGYQAGRGDGDRTIQAVMPLGDALYIFKTNSIYVVEGYDFQTGEYQFTVRPLKQGIGTTAPHSLARLTTTSSGSTRDMIIFWSGSQVYALSQDGTTTPMGTKVINELSQAALYNQGLMRATAGSFNVAAANNPTVYTDFYFLAIDRGTGVADTILVYDDLATLETGVPCWSVWTGLTIGAFIPWQGPGDKKYLYFGDGSKGQINLLGQNAANDSGNTIAFQVTTGRIDCGSPDAWKKLERIFLEVEAGAAGFAITVAGDDVNLPSVSVNANTNAVTAGVWGTAVWGTDVFGAAQNTLYQTTIADVQAFFRAHNFTITVSENSTSAVYEILSLNLDVLEEAKVR